MKRMCLGVCLAVFAIAGGTAVSEDMDIRVLQAKLAAQEARLNDLQARMSGTRGENGITDDIVSLRKNATVTLGGILNTRYFYHDATVKSRLEVIDGPNDRRFARIRSVERIGYEDFKHGDLKIADAKIDIKIDVNEYFDAFIQLDLQDAAGRANVSGIADNYWIRWKNVCNSGFGLLAGRDSLKFGDVKTYRQYRRLGPGSGRLGGLHGRSELLRNP